MSENGKDTNQYELLDKLESGKIISQDILDSIKEENQELYELLLKSNRLRSAKKIKPDPLFSRVSQIHVYLQIVEGQKPKYNPLERIKLFLSELSPPAPPALSFRPVFTFVLVMVLSFSLFVGGVQAADDSGPGQLLYPIDRAYENVQYAMALNDQNRLKLNLSFAEERLDEAEIAISEGDFENAEIAIVAYEHTQKTINTQLGSTSPTISENLKSSAFEARQKNAGVLTVLLETAPESAQATIQHAIDVAQEVIVSPPIVEGTLEPPSGNEGGPDITQEPSGQTTTGQEPTISPTLIAEDHIFVTVRVYSVNVHTGPGLDFPVVGWLFQNQTIMSGTCLDGFMYIKEFSGWASGTCFTPNPCGPPGSCKSIWD